MKNFKRILTAAVAASMLMCGFAGCGEDESKSSGDNKTAAVDGESFIITLYPEYAPITCENFEKLVSEGFYDGVTFHRVVDGFMAQGGDPDGDGSGGSPDTIKGEFASNGVNNTLSHQRGIVSMARTMVPDSASSQFFICYADASFLDGEYAAFGEVTEGMEVVDKFLEVERTYGSDGAISAPTSPITISKAVMLEDDSEGNPRAQFTMEEIPVK